MTARAPLPTRFTAAGGSGTCELFVLDNYDSFTFNLVQYLTELGADITVARNDTLTPADVLNMNVDGVVISPGPGVPADAGISKALVEAVSGTVPLLGVCLGHQALGEVFGAAVVRADRLMHGKTSEILHDGSALFEGLDSPFTATRYHSLILDRATVGEPLEITAWTAENEVMAVRHRTHPTWGVQFHPESILTTMGKTLLGNFLRRCAPAEARPAEDAAP
jgi:anthranilate synthase/aminodeoxychorismate synthase-like glutamine amidotransferase